MDKKGNGSEIPELISLNKRLTESEIDNILLEGRRRMPSFKQLSSEERKTLILYLLNRKQSMNGKVNIKSLPVYRTQPYDPPYRAKVWVRLLDPEGYPAVKPPWGTLNAIDLKTGDYLWRVPLGEFPELTKKGIPITGTENYGGPVVTEGGLVFIAATRDEKIRAFNKTTGKIVWEQKLPAAGFATPITYAVHGRQFIVIAAGGGRGLKSGDAYVAFALPSDK